MMVMSRRITMVECFALDLYQRDKRIPEIYLTETEANLAPAPILRPVIRRVLVSRESGCLLY